MTAVILRKQPGGVIPEDVIEKIAKEFGKSWGASYIESGELNIGRGEDADIELITETQTNLLDDHAVFFFSNEEDEQPFDLVSEVDKDEDGDEVEVPQISVFLEGKFKLVSDKVDVPAREIAGHLRKKVGMYMKVHDEDVTKVMAEIRENDVDFMNLIGDRGVMVFVADDGDVAVIAKNQIEGKYDWGWMSNNLGFLAGAAQPQGAAEKVKSMFNKARSAVRGKPGSAPAPEPAKEEPASAEPKKEEEVKTTPVNTVPAKDVATEMIWWRPTPDMSRSQKKDKYKALNQSLSAIDWKGNAPVLVPVELKDKMSAKFGGEWLTNEEAKKLLAEKFPSAHSKPPAAEAGTKLSGVEGKKALPDGVHEVPQSVNTEAVNDRAPNAKQVTTEILPILSKTSLKAIVDGPILKTLDTHSVESPDATTLQQMEKKYPPVMKQMGKSPDAWLKWEYTGIRELNAAHPDVLPILICDARLALWRLEQTIKDQQKVIAKLNGEKKEAPATELPKSGGEIKHQRKFGQGYKKSA